MIAKNLAYPVSGRVVSAAVTSEAARLLAEPVSVFSRSRQHFRSTSGGPPLPTDNRGSYDIATLAIFPEYVEFDAAEVLQFVVPVPAGKTPA